MAGTRDQYLPIQKYLYTSAATLTLYDFMLVLDDEIKYIWKGPKSRVFYTYFLVRPLDHYPRPFSDLQDSTHNGVARCQQYRSILIGYQLWHFCLVMFYPNGTGSLYTVDSFIQGTVILLSMVFADGFVILRTYAITFKNKTVASYLAVLALGRFLLAIVGFLIVNHRSVQNATISVGTAFEISAFTIVVWYAYRNKNVFRFSGLARTVVSQAIVYVVFIIFVQIFTQVSLNFMEVDKFEVLSFGIYGLVNPALIVRFIIALKRLGDPVEDGSRHGVVGLVTSCSYPELRRVELPNTRETCDPQF